MSSFYTSRVHVYKGSRVTAVIYLSTVEFIYSQSHFDLQSSNMPLPTKLFKELAAKVRKKEGADRLRDLTFSSSSTSISSVIKTTDLRLDCHKNSRDPTMATGIIQVNREAKSSEAKKFIRGSSKGHSGTHQVIAKIPFHTGQNFDAQALASGIEAAGGILSASGDGSSGTSSIMTDASGRQYYVDANGNSQWVTGTNAPAPSSTSAIPSWQWDQVRQSNYYLLGDQRVYQQEAVRRADTAWQWDPYVQQQCMWYNGVYINAAGSPA